MARNDKTRPNSSKSRQISEQKANKRWSTYGEEPKSAILTHKTLWRKYGSANDLKKSRNQRVWSNGVIG